MALTTLSEPPSELPPPTDGAGITPLMAQYLAMRRAHPDCLLFYRMGDFYELFFEDAVAAAAALDITLTRRGKHEGKDIAMCGVPVHAADAYLAKLIRKGFKVAICEQVEDPAAARRRGAKAVVERAVVRLVTPGTLTEDTLLDARAHNYLAAVAEAGGGLGLAWLDLSTGGGSDGGSESVVCAMPSYAKPSAASSGRRNAASWLRKNSSSCGGATPVPDSMAWTWPR